VIGAEHAKLIAETFLGLTETFDPNGPSAKNVQAIDELSRKYSGG
jgi:ribose 5-phosphate isomerase B